MGLSSPGGVTLRVPLFAKYPKAGSETANIVKVIDENGVYIGPVSSTTDTFTNPKIVTGLLDANGNVSLALSATASAVNGLGVTNAATGNGATNPVTLAPSGTDAAIALSIAPKGAAGVLTLGLASGTADIVLGSSSGAQAVKIANGAGAPTVNIAQVSTAGASVAIAGAVTAAGLTDEVDIALGNAAATAFKIVKIATGTPATSGNNRIQIGGGLTSSLAVNAVFRTYQAENYIATETGANNALVATMTDGFGNNVTVQAGLAISLKLAHSLQAGANTLNLNGHGTDSIKKASNPATDISVTAVSGSILYFIFDGTVWQCQGQ